MSHSEREKAECVLEDEITKLYELEHLLNQRGDLAGQVGSTTEICDRLTEYLKEWPDDQQAKASLAASSYNLSSLLTRLGLKDEARSKIAVAVAQYAQLVTEDQRFQVRYGDAMVRAARLASYEMKFDVAAKYLAASGSAFDAAEAGLDKELGRLRAFSTMGGLYLSTGSFQALGYFDEALRIGNSLLVDNDLDGGNAPFGWLVGMPSTLVAPAPTWLEAAVAARELHLLRSNFDLATGAGNFAVKILGGMKLTMAEAVWQDVFSLQMASLAAIPKQKEDRGQRPAEPESDSRILDEDVHRIFQAMQSAAFGP